MTKVNSKYKGIARALTEGIENTYGNTCSCPIDFLIDHVFNGSPLLYVSNFCRNCKKRNALIERILNYDEFEEEEVEPKFQVNLMLPETPLSRMLNYAKELGPHYFLFSDMEEDQ